MLRDQNRKSVSLKVIINPVLTIEDSSVAEHFEGCLSVEGYRAVVPRPKSAQITGLNRNGKKVIHQAEGWLARIFQHESDHLDGKLYVDSVFSKPSWQKKHILNSGRISLWLS